jgi:TolB-like protein
MFTRAAKGSVNCARYLVTAEGRDHPLDLPPVAKARDIAVVAAALGADRRFEPGVIAKAVDQLGGISQRNAAVDEGTVHAPLLATRRFPTADDRRQRGVDHVGRALRAASFTHTVRRRWGQLMSDVFVSYKAEDRKRVKPLVEALESDGYSVWWDEQIGGGTAWRQSIEAELNAAKCVIVVWSKRSVGPDGAFVQDEATRAQQRHVYVPVLIDKVHLPLGFGETQALPLTGWRGDRSDLRYRAVLTAVRRNVAGKRRVARSPLPRASFDRRTMIVGGTAAAIAVVGAGAWGFLKPGSASAAGDSIAVLPFENLSGNPAQAYFSDGIAEEIRSALARIAGVKVVGRTSSEAVRNNDAATAAKKLGVANILTGSVRQSPSTIRVNAELIDGRSGIDKWSQNYDRSPGDVIKIQTDIAENVAGALSAALGQAARMAIAIGGTSNAAALDLYLKARAQSAADDSENSLHLVVELLDSAIELDPKYAAAYAEKAQAMNVLAGYFTSKTDRFGPAFAQSAAVARQAIALATNFAAGHTSLANTLLAQLDLGAAALEFERSHALAGSDVDQLLSYIRFRSLIGRKEEAIALANRAQARDPLSPGAYSRHARALLDAERFGESAIAFRETLELAPNRLVDRSLMSFALMALEKYDEAFAEIEKLPANFRLVGEAILFARAGNRAKSDDALERIQQLGGEAANYQYAQIYAQRGDKDRAFSALDRAWGVRDPGLSGMKVDFFFDPIRSDPHFGALLQKMNFPT